MTVSVILGLRVSAFPVPPGPSIACLAAIYRETAGRGLSVILDLRLPLSGFNAGAGMSLVFNMR